MSKVLVTRCEYFWMEGWFRYVGYSTLFQPIAEGEKPFRYEISKDEFSDIKVTKLPTSIEFGITRERPEFPIVYDDL